jgi:hypothetical protein
LRRIVAVVGLILLYRCSQAPVPARSPEGSDARILDKMLVKPLSLECSCARFDEMGTNVANRWYQLLRRAQRYQELPLAALHAIAELRPQLVEVEQAAVQAAREKGATWEEIATAMGITRQAVQMRFRAGST